MHKIGFHNQDTNFKLSSKTKLSNWIREVINNECDKTIVSINYIFCSDEYLYGINKKFLNHNTYTDIITFNNSDNDAEIEADIFISIQRVKENSILLKQEFDIELNRVIIHGVLHLLGWGDKTEEAKKKMREKENECLFLLK